MNKQPKSPKYATRPKRSKSKKSSIDSDDFFKRIRLLGYSDSDFANAVGVSSQTVKGWGVKPIPLFAERILVLLEHLKESKEFLTKDYLIDNNATIKPKRLRGTKI